MPPRTRTATPTRADLVLADIRADILNGRLAPGSRLGFAGLGERYDVSTGVLREVLPRLVEQGLATSESQLGFRVIDVSVDRLQRLTEARVALDTLVTREAIAHGDLAWEAGVVATHHTLARSGGENEAHDISEDWILAHEAFHVAILGGCPNEYLVDAAVRLRSISLVYRVWSAPAAERAHRDVEQEHREIMESVVARDSDRAAELTVAHIRRSTDLLISGRPADAPVA
ncbi:GntR family transcriptional regulator [Nocardioides endophyticus]